MIEDQPGRGESEEAGVIRERSLKEHEHSDREISEKAEVTEEDELEEEQIERGSDRKEKQPGRGSDNREKNEEVTGRKSNLEEEVIIERKMRNSQVGESQKRQK